MIYQTKEYMEFQAWHDESKIITAGGMPLLLKNGLAYTPNNSYGGPTEGFCHFDFINDLKNVGAKEYLIRFSPWLFNRKYFDNAVFSRHTMARDLSVPIKWGHGTKSSIKKNIDSGCECDIIPYNPPYSFMTLYELLQFHSRYFATMIRNDAEECYKYSINYFLQLLEYLKGNIDLITVTSPNNRIIAAATFLHDKYTAHYQFSGMDIEYAHMYPMERLLSEACHHYQQQDKHLIHFGGGLSEDDSLHKFKKKFGNIELEYWTARGEA